MKSHIFCNRHEVISHNIMRSHLNPTMNATKNVDPMAIGSYWIFQFPHLWIHSSYQYNKEQDCLLLFPLKWFLPCNSAWCPFAMLNIGHWTWGYIIQYAKHCHHKGIPTPPHHYEWELGNPLVNDWIALHLHWVQSCTKRIWLKDRNFAWSCLCESPSNPRGKFFFCLTNPNTSSPSKCNIFNVYEELEANLATTTAICNGSPY